mgnify:CR=1 FL=1
MKVKELIERLKQLPQDATVINYNEEAVVYNSINDLQVDLCPNCKVYCTKRFIDGRCE